MRVIIHQGIKGISQLNKSKAIQHIIGGLPPFLTSSSGVDTRIWNETKTLEKFAPGEKETLDLQELHQWILKCITKDFDWKIKCIGDICDS